MFSTIDSEHLLARVRLLPSGLRQLSDMRSRLGQAMSMNQVFRENPITAALPEVWLIALKATLEAAKYPHREEVIRAVQQAIAMQQATAAQQATAVQQATAAQQAMAVQQAMAGAGMPAEGMPAEGMPAEGIPAEGIPAA